MLIGGLGGILLERVVLPSFSIISPQTPIVINKKEEIRITEGVNTGEIVNRVTNSMATVIVHDGVFGADKFRLQQVATGMVVGSDGFVMVTSQSIRAGQQITVVGADRRAYPAKLVASDALTGLSFLKIPASDLSVARPGRSRELQVGDRLLAIWITDSPGNIRLSPVFTTQKSLPAPGLAKTYELSTLNSFLLTDLNPTLVPPGALIFDRDAALVGAVTQPGREIAVVRSEDLKLLLDKFFAAGTKTVSWPSVKLSYRILGPGETALLGLPKTAGIQIKAGPAPLRESDFVFAVDGREIGQDAQEILLGKNPGDKVKLKALRNGQELEMEITL